MIDIGPVETTVTGEVGYGLGGSINGNVGFDDWTFEIEGGISGYLGVGLGFGVDVEIDLKEIAGYANPLSWFD